MIDLNKTPKIKIHVPTKEISEQVQQALFKLGCSWFPEKFPMHTDKPYLFVSSTCITYTDDLRYFKMQPHIEVKYQDILGPSLPFQVGDKVRAFGFEGTVERIGGHDYPVQVRYCNEYSDTFTVDGRLYDWHKAPVLELVARPTRTEKRTFYIWSHNGKIQNELMDDGHCYVDGKGRPLQPGDWKKLEGTAVTIEVPV